MEDERFMKEIKLLTTSEEILCWYKTVYSEEPIFTEHGIMAHAIPDVLSEYSSQKTEIKRLKQELDIAKAMHKEAVAERDLYIYKLMQLRGDESAENSCVL